MCFDGVNAFGIEQESFSSLKFFSFPTQAKLVIFQSFNQNPLHSTVTLNIDERDLDFCHPAMNSTKVAAKSPDFFKFFLITIKKYHLTEKKALPTVNLMFFKQCRASTSYSRLRETTNCQEQRERIQLLPLQTRKSQTSFNFLAATHISNLLGSSSNSVQTRFGKKSVPNPFCKNNNCNPHFTNLSPRNENFLEFELTFIPFRYQEMDFSEIENINFWK